MIPRTGSAPKSDRPHTNLVTRLAQFATRQDCNAMSTQRNVHATRWRLCKRTVQRPHTRKKEQVATPITLDELAELCKERKMTYADARDYLDGVRTPPPRHFTLTEVDDAELDWLEKQARSDYGLTRAEQQRVIFTLRRQRERHTDMTNLAVRLLTAKDGDIGRYKERIWMLRHALQYATIQPPRSLDDIRDIATNALRHDNAKEREMNDSEPPKQSRALGIDYAIAGGDRTVTVQRPGAYKGRDRREKIGS